MTTTTMLDEAALHAGQTLGEIAAQDVRKADVLKKHGLDFCCGGKKTLAAVCEEKGLNTAAIAKELEEAPGRAVSSLSLHFAEWKPDFLADYIVNVHHAYVRHHSAEIEYLAEKVYLAHGQHHPALGEINDQFGLLKVELLNHLIKEEEVLFPYIKMLQAKVNGDVVPLSMEDINVKAPVSMMEVEHELAGDIMRRIRVLTNDYQAPERCCNSFRLLFHRLAEFESDLHQHIHLENNILFPAAIRLEEKMQLA
ncbi:iron-sulfur cluster repair di-iron protein [Chitinophaga defluvii]|uniref:Iron-sulfur cluster repair di-iron protein n=1 Tax=Chitinophaga defluvii TaxID=3163343 RepID=A0ABV2T1L2_9BACT